MSDHPVFVDIDPDQTPAIQQSGVPKIRLRGLKKHFGAKKVLDGVDLDVWPGESVIIIGGSGTGKSVLLKCILGLMLPDAGSIEIDGQETTHMTGHARRELMLKFGMLFQGGALFDSLPVWQNVAFGLIQGQGMGRKEAREVAIQTLGLVGLAPDVADLFPAELSGGMQKRVGLARAVASRPDIIFFDEPTTGLDPIMADVINNLIVRSTRHVGATGLSITHDMASARVIANRVAMLHKGQIIWQGPAETLENSGNPYVDQFVHGREDGPIQAVF